MLEFILNPLSPAGQCTTDDAAARVIKGVMGCLGHLEPLIIHGRGVIYFDARVEERKLGPNNVYSVAIAKLMNTADAPLARRWYLYRKRLKRVGNVECHVVMESGDKDGNCITSVSGDVSHEIFISNLVSLSFGGGFLTESKRLSFSSDTTRNEIINHHCLTSLKASLPFYKASSKHRSVKYFDGSRREWVAPMTLPEDLAQEVLSLGVRHENDYFGYHALSKKIIRFKQTLGNEYHGFEVEAAELPNGIASQIFLP